MTSSDTTQPLPADDLSRSLVVSDPAAPGLRHIFLAGGSYTILVSGSQTQGKYCLIDMLVPAQGGPPPHRHDFEEAFTILEGSLEFTFRCQTHTVSAPATVAIPANAPHSFRNVSGKPAHMLCLCAGAGQEDFFATVGVLVPSRDAPPPVLSPAEQAEKRALAESLAGQFRTEFLVG
ncbi:cupin domain-containing protein [Acidisphaera sp. L21]|uniref:cupin domain-containing protein n=1 Tax=Acidisphaera sp. L21 TaxID=1641851 RepID=UPI00131A62DE|nr:cupin domain-containing protein [Acidisphaera sp. L21]